MWWGYSPALDIQSEINKHEINCADEYLEILIVGASDARHILKTLASSYLYNDRIIIYNVIESTLEQVARSILLLNTCLETNLGLQEATRYYLEIFGNTLIRPATAKYLIKSFKQLSDIVTTTIDCPWLNLEQFMYKDRDQLQAIFKYDYRGGVFDWDYHMILKSRGISNLTLQEYRFWRNNGIAFSWLEGELIRSNPTLLNNIMQYDSGYVHYIYSGDITNGPFFCWTLQEERDNDKMCRATDIAEREIMKCIYEIMNQKSMCEEIIAAHRDSSILNGTLVIETPNKEIEQELWKKSKNKYKSNISWINVKNHKIIFHPVTFLSTSKHKTKYIDRFDFIWIAHNMVEQLSNLVPLLKEKGIMLVELKKCLVELRNENLQNFVNELKSMAQRNRLREINDINIKEHYVARFSK
ncbi:Dynein assembly factor 3, axonemal [Melipona quadrifasciata]|uniref:Dynein assembly factor 3, axonemal n=1 Tax=Melipona quadrifasciata TaxID=166423 RepID=A0A0N0BGJ3_9HYME|nr:Dynein assembly factor 3, axonemal [Melipona quadrifasciata]